MYSLKDLPLFSQLTHEQLIDLNSQMHTSAYEKDSIVFYEGDERKYLT